MRDIFRIVRALFPMPPLLNRGEHGLPVQGCSDMSDRVHEMAAQGKDGRCGARFVGLMLAVVIVLAGCSAEMQAVRIIDGSVPFENSLVVKDLVLGYPDDMHEAVDESENGAIPYTNTMFGGALVASSKAASKQDVLFMLEAAEAGSGRTLSDVEADYKRLEPTVNVTNEYGYTRLSLGKTRAVVNGMPCVVIDMTLKAPEQAGGMVARGIFYVLADENENIIGQVEGYFYGRDYDEDPALYDSIFASVMRVDGIDG